MRVETIDDRGQGMPIVYTPGIDGTGWLLLDQAPRIASRFRLIRLRYVDGGDDTYESMAASLAEALDHASIERAVLLAESFGGAVAMQTAISYPDRVAALAIVNSFPYFQRRPHLELSRLGAALTPRWLWRLGRQVLAAHLLFGERREREAIARFKALDGRHMIGPLYRRRLDMIRRLDLRPRLSEIHHPTTLVVGDRDRIVDSVQQARIMRGAMRAARIEVVQGGGHLILPLATIHWPERLAELIARCNPPTDQAANPVPS
ncbi:MAG: alpha/beta hydrolase [Acidobacteriota bacterium]